MARKPPAILTRLTTETGEVYRMTQERQPGSSFGRAFMVVFKDVAASLARDQDAPGDALRVLFWGMGGALHHEQWRALRQAEVGGELGISGATVSRCLSYLLGVGLVERRGAGPRQEWRLSPEGSWVGAPGGWHKRRREAARPQLRVVGKPVQIERAGDADEQA